MKKNEVYAMLKKAGFEMDVNPNIVLIINCYKRLPEILKIFGEAQGKVEISLTGTLSVTVENTTFIAMDW